MYQALFFFPSRAKEVKQKKQKKKRRLISGYPRLYHTFLAYPVEKYPFSDFHITTITAGFNPL